MGSTGGGRDKWKRPVMGKIASENCEYVILTNEDPYDEDPRVIIAELAGGMAKKAEVVLDRRQAIARGISVATALRQKSEQVALLITGKGTDPTIQGPKHTAMPWSDAQVAREELESVLRSQQV
jgi:UDP-N-acetylmuramyl tripeptide synthase